MSSFTVHWILQRKRDSPVLVHSQGVLQASGLDSGIGAGTAILGYLGPSREDPLRPFSSTPRHLASGALFSSLASL